MSSSHLSLHYHIVFGTKGRLLVEPKSRGEDLGLAATQALTYIADRLSAGWKPASTLAPGNTRGCPCRKKDRAPAGAR